MQWARRKFSSKLLLVAATVLSLFFLPGCGADTESEPLAVFQETDQLLADSLTTVYNQLVLAAHRQDSDEIRNLLNSEEIIKLTSIAQNYGHKSLVPFLAWIVKDWPNLDNQKLTEIIKSTPYVRLTFTGDKNSSLAGSDRIRRFTFLLFKQNSDHWEFVTLSRLHKEKKGLYGYAITYHETDLPPQLRFPRRF